MAIRCVTENLFTDTDKRKQKAEITEPGIVINKSETKTNKNK